MRVEVKMVKDKIKVIIFVPRWEKYVLRTAVPQYTIHVETTLTKILREGAHMIIVLG